MEIIPYESCSHCDGRGYFTGYEEDRLYKEVRFVMINVACSRCEGLGWNTKVETVDRVEVDNKEKKVA